MKEKMENHQNRDFFEGMWGENMFIKTILIQTILNEFFINFFRIIPLKKM